MDYLEMQATLNHLTEKDPEILSRMVNHLIDMESKWRFNSQVNFVRRFLLSSNPNLTVEQVKALAPGDNLRLLAHHPRVVEVELHLLAGDKVDDGLKKLSDLKQETPRARMVDFDRITDWIASPSLASTSHDELLLIAHYLAMRQAGTGYGEQHARSVLSFANDRAYVQESILEDAYKKVQECIYYRLESQASRGNASQDDLDELMKDKFTFFDMMRKRAKDSPKRVSSTKTTSPSGTRKTSTESSCPSDRPWAEMSDCPGASKGRLPSTSSWATSTAEP